MILLEFWGKISICYSIASVSMLVLGCDCWRNLGTRNVFFFCLQYYNKTPTVSKVVPQFFLWWELNWKLNWKSFRQVPNNSVTILRQDLSFKISCSKLQRHGNKSLTWGNETVWKLTDLCYLQIVANSQPMIDLRKDKLGLKAFQFPFIVLERYRDQSPLHKLW